MLWLTHYNSESDWRTEEVKIIRYLKEYRKQWRLEQKKPVYKREKIFKKIINIKKITKEWEIWNKEKEVAELEKEAKKLVPQVFTNKYIFL